MHLAMFMFFTIFSRELHFGLCRSRKTDCLLSSVVWVLFVLFWVFWSLSLCCKMEWHEGGSRTSGLLPSRLCSKRICPPLSRFFLVGFLGCEFRWNGRKIFMEELILMLAGSLLPLVGVFVFKTKTSLRRGSCSLESLWLQGTLRVCSVLED